METVLVLPLYLMLLGGMFIVGDLMLGRFVLQASGRYEAWSTHARVVFPDTISVFRYAEVKPAFHLEHDENGEISPFSTGFRITGNVRANGNMWAYARIGLTRGTVEVPFWAAMVDVQRNTIDPDREATESKNRIHADGTTFAWAFDYHRISEADIAELGGNPEVFRRSNPVGKLQESSIVLDSHFCGPVNGREPHEEQSPYQRNPLLMALGM
jgi:hypothetical protein